MNDTKVAEVMATPIDRRVTFASLNEIKDPGVYVDTQFPRYFRVSEKGVTLAAGAEGHGSEFTVARVSADPKLSKSQVQKLCTDNKLPSPE